MHGTGRRRLDHRVLPDQLVADLGSTPGRLLLLDPQDGALDLERQAVGLPIGRPAAVVEGIQTTFFIAIEDLVAGGPFCLAVSWMKMRTAVRQNAPAFWTCEARPERVRIAHAKFGEPFFFQICEVVASLETTSQSRSIRAAAFDKCSGAKCEYRNAIRYGFHPLIMISLGNIPLPRTARRQICRSSPSGYWPNSTRLQYQV